MLLSWTNYHEYSQEISNYSALDITVKPSFMKATIAEKIITEIYSDAENLEGGQQVTVTLKSGKTFTFNTAENDELILENIANCGFLEVWIISDSEGVDGGTAWIDLEEIAAIQI